MASMLHTRYQPKTDHLPAFTTCCGIVDEAADAYGDKIIIKVAAAIQMFQSV